MVRRAQCPAAQGVAAGGSGLGPSGMSCPAGRAYLHRSPLAESLDLCELSRHRTCPNNLWARHATSCPGQRGGGGNALPRRGAAKLVRRSGCEGGASATVSEAPGKERERAEGGGDAAEESRRHMRVGRLRRRAESAGRVCPTPAGGRVPWWESWRGAESKARIQRLASGTGGPPAGRVEKEGAAV